MNVEQCLAAVNTKPVELDCESAVDNCRHICHLLLLIQEAVNMFDRRTCLFLLRANNNN